MEPTRRTPAELKDLLADWESDPSWELVDSRGFEAHGEELAAHQAAFEQRQEQEQAAEQMRRLAEMRLTWGADLPDAALMQIWYLQNRVRRLQETVDLIKPAALYDL
jgi:hypothetical protein